jgi:hypothetical protein
VRLAPLFLPLALVLGCAAGNEAECVQAGDCAPADAVCDGCPPEGDTLCVGGVCAPRGTDAVDVSGTVSIDRDIADGVESFVHALIATEGAGGAVGCSDALAGTTISPTVNVLAAGFKNVSGGSFHPDVSLGRAPDQDLLVVVVAHDDSGGGGAAVGAGCIGPISAVDGSIVIEILNVVP